MPSGSHDVRQTAGARVLSSLPLTAGLSIIDAAGVDDASTALRVDTAPGIWTIAEAGVAQWDPEFEETEVTSWLLLLRGRVERLA